MLLSYKYKNHSDPIHSLDLQIKYLEDCYVACFVDEASPHTLNGIWLQIKALKAELEKTAAG